MDKYDTLRRILIIGWPIYVFRQNLCILGLCEPISAHTEVVQPDLPSLLLTIASALVIAEREYYPRRIPFRPLPRWLIIIMEVLMALLINNLVLRLVWLPGLHILLVNTLTTIAEVFEKVNEVLGDNFKVFGDAAAWLKSEDGIFTCATLLASYVLLRTFYYLYWDSLKAHVCKFQTHSAPPASSCGSSLQVPRRLLGPGRGLRPGDGPDGNPLGSRDDYPVCKRNNNAEPRVELRRSARIQNQMFNHSSLQNNIFEY